MHSSKPSQLSACQTSDALSVRTVSTKVRLRARLCTVSLLSADLGAFALSAFVAFALCVASDTSPYQRAITNVTTLGAGWHGWGSMLVLASLLSYLRRARSLHVARALVDATGRRGRRHAVALACDIFLTVAIYDRPVATRRPAALGARLPMPAAAARCGPRVLHLSGIWTLRTLIVASPRKSRQREAALTSDPALGYKLAGIDRARRTPRRLATRNCWTCWSQRGAEFVVIVAGG